MVLTDEASLAAQVVEVRNKFKDLSDRLDSYGFSPKTMESFWWRLEQNSNFSPELYRAMGKAFKYPWMLEKFDGDTARQRRYQNLIRCQVIWHFTPDMRRTVSDPAQCRALQTLIMGIVDTQTELWIKEDLLEKVQAGARGQSADFKGKHQLRMDAHAKVMIPQLDNVHAFFQGLPNGGKDCRVS